ncbi:MAG TPA: Rrf2 family transcriptional regulator [Phycisphaerales bacterium]|nr:Rrf2 family transcriptional regulator [Phycisphaerales bacterium]
MLSRTTEYALRATAVLACAPDRLMPTATLSERTSVPEHYLAKVLQNLAASKLVSGRRGVGGGYRLARPPEQITLLDVVRSIEPVEALVACPLGLKLPDPALCPLHATVNQLAAAAIGILGSTTLGDLLADGRNRPICACPEPMIPAPGA